MNLPSMRAPRAPRLASLAVLALAASSWLIAGCSDMETIEAEVEPEDHRMVVMPMKDRLQYHFDSQRGIGLARLITERILAERKKLGEDAMDVVAFEELEEQVAKMHTDPKDLKPEDVGRMVKADYVLVGNIESFEPRIPGDVGFMRGRATCSFKVIDVAKPSRPVFAKKLDIKFPEETRTSTGVLQTADADVAKIEAGLLEVLAKKIGEVFYPHDEKKDRNPGAGL